ncbi:ABC transporter ATP-binding protein [Actomonas aquatica]|uniref:ABC transporter ATP-binding protein n=1 Tax=Actomonas aquatica TaxID=2866162 RepID=A0ABZ1C433_9BACT|nr:ABC transporter ATP-binding protein [Opitutus sp. WL0086]WRQ86472.1 ABC transporter ATP-binding protein [Opitutus sp. WL0086]
MSESRGEVIAMAREVVKSYDKGRITVLRGVSLEVRAGELVSLWGASGSGKSTLLHLLGGLDLPDSGDLKVCGLDPRLEADRLELRRRHLGYVFQLHNLIPDLTVEENVRVPALAVGRSPKETAARVRQLAEEVGIAHRLDHRIQDLSGGERQRTAICRALLNAPRLLLADEPTGSLDEQTGETVFGLLKTLAEREKIAVVLATHERRFAEQCHRIVRVRNGLLSEV